MGLTLATADAYLKDLFEGAVRETINSQVPMFKMLRESDKPWTGRRVIFPFHTTRNSGVGARADNGTLPTAGRQGHQQSIITATYQYVRIELTGPSIRSSKNAFVEAVASEMEGATNDSVNDLGRQTWGTGDGRLAQVGADSVTTTASQVFVYNRFQKPGQPGARYIAASQILDLGTVADPDAEAASQTVVSVSVSQNPATTTDTVTFSNSALLVSQSDTFLFNVAAGNLEMLGMRALVDAFSEANVWGSNAYAGSSIQNINRASVERFNSLVLGNSQTARILDGNLMQQAFDRVNIEDGSEVDFITGHHDVVRVFLDHVSADRRYGSPSFDAGFTNLTYNGVPLVRDRQAPYNELYLINKSAIKQFTLLDMEWADDDGAILSRVQNKDSWEAFMRCYKNLGFDGSPKKCLVIRDIRTDL